MLTAAEIAFIGSGIGVVGTVSAVFVGAYTGRRAARQTMQEQRKLEAERRYDDRLAALYQDSLQDMQILMRDQSRREWAKAFPAAGRGRFRGARARPALPNFAGDEVGERRANLTSRMELFASAEVRDLFDAWLAVYSERFFPPFAEDQPQRLAAARAALVAQMRRELEGWRF